MAVEDCLHCLLPSFTKYRRRLTSNSGQNQCPFLRPLELQLLPHFIRRHRESSLLDLENPDTVNLYIGLDALHTERKAVQNPVRTCEQCFAESIRREIRNLEIEFPSSALRRNLLDQVSPYHCSVRLIQIFRNRRIADWLNLPLDQRLPSRQHSGPDLRVRFERTHPLQH